MAAQLKYPYTGKCLSIITGASRGFGRTIAQLLCHKEHGILGNAEKGSKIILMARNTADMENTKVLIENAEGNFDVDIVPVDLYDVAKSSEVINKTLEMCETDFNNVFLFNNAATVGDPSKQVDDYTDINDIKNFFNLNVISGSFLISRFCKHFEGTSNRFVVQVSSLCAIQPVASIGLYCSSKAAMDMYIRNLAVDCPQVRALNYAPGPMDTDMAHEIHNKTTNKETKAMFNDLVNNGKMLKTEQSVKKLMMLLRKNEFENAAHIDYYDV